MTALFEESRPSRLRLVDSRSVALILRDTPDFGRFPHTYRVRRFLSSSLGTLMNQPLTMKTSAAMYCRPTHHCP